MSTRVSKPLVLEFDAEPGTLSLPHVVLVKDQTDSSAAELQQIIDDMILGGVLTRIHLVTWLSQNCGEKDTDRWEIEATHNASETRIAFRDKMDLALFKLRFA